MTNWIFALKTKFFNSHNFYVSALRFFFQVLRAVNFHIWHPLDPLHPLHPRGKWRSKHMCRGFLRVHKRSFVLPGKRFRWQVLTSSVRLRRFQRTIGIKNQKNSAVLSGGQHEHIDHSSHIHIQDRKGCCMWCLPGETQRGAESLLQVGQKTFDSLNDLNLF